MWWPCPCCVPLSFHPFPGWATFRPMDDNMSIEQPLDPQLIEQTKQQIRMLVNEISQLAKSDKAPEEFYAEFLPRVVSALAAVGGVVWVVGDGGRLTLGYQINLQQTRLRESEENQIRHGRLIQKVLGTGEGALVPPQSGAADDEQGANPTDFLLVLAPLRAAEETVGVVEVFQRANTRPATQKGYLRFLMEMCDRAGEFFKSHQLRHFTDRQVLWTQLEEFTRGVHASLDPRQTAYVVANDGRRLIECDRVSVAIRKGRRCHIEAVSGQDLFDKRSNTVRLLGKLATVVVASEEPVWYTGDTSNFPPQVEDAMQEYVDESHSKTVAVLPLTRPQPLAEEEDDPDKRPEHQPPIGALIVEQIEDSRVPPKLVQRVEVVCEHSSTALANSLEHNNLFLMPVWRALGKASWVIKGRTLPKTVAITGAVLALIVAMLVVPWGFKMRAEGSIMPVESREVFADIDGVVEEVLVSDDDLVEKGQVLVRLQNTELELRIKENRGQLDATIQAIGSIRAQLAQETRQRDPAGEIKLQGDLSAYEAKKANLLEQKRLYEDQSEKLNVRAPAKGQVVTWDVENVLMRRPVKRGDVLMRIADPEGPWELEILMPDKRMGHVARAEKAQQEKEPGVPLTVEFILATDSDTTYRGTVREIGEAADVRGEEGNVVPIKVDIGNEVIAQLEQLPRPGTGVTAKIDCGYRPVGYVMFHELFAFIESKILFRWF
jgi:hypothetical protein